MPKKRFQCDICNKQFADRHYLVSHQYVHTSDTPFGCPQCSYRGKTKKYLARHVKKVHIEKTGEHKCNVCGKFFHHHSSMKVHAMVHTGEKPHSCKVCGKTFRVTYSLNSHMLIHTNEKPFQCSFCEYACRDSSTLRKHQYKHMGLQKTYECNICNKGYSVLAKLKVHIAEQHLNIDVKKYPCDQCKKVFKSSAHRKRHIDSVHKRTLVCTCPICGRRLMSKNNLPKHMRTHLEERPFTCTHSGCGIAFKDKSSLKKHVVIHEPPRYACSHCGRKFARKSYVQYHERVMHLERQRSVECDYCGSRFYSKNYLRKHIQTKHVYKHQFKYICDICGLVTHNKPSIVMHLKYGHSNDHDLQCKICDTKIVYKKHLYLKMHYWKTHNIRYKITRKATNSMAARKEKQEKAMVEVKMEPIEADYEEVPMLDVEKFEQQEEDECSEYSRQVLAEDITFAHGPRANATDFDACFVRRVIGGRRVNAHEVNTDGINEEQDLSVKRRIKQIITKTNNIEKARALREKRKNEEKLKRENETREAQLKADRRREEMIELARVREMYNERMKAALAKQKEKKEKVKIKYFKIPENSNDKNDKTTEENFIVPAENISEECTEVSNNDIPIEEYHNTKCNEITLNSVGNDDFDQEKDIVYSDDENHDNNNEINDANVRNGDFSNDICDTVLSEVENHHSNNENNKTTLNTEGASDFSKENDDIKLSDDGNHHSNNENDDTLHSDDVNHEIKNGNDERNQNTEGAGDFSQENDSTALSDDKNHYSNNENDDTLHYYEVNHQIKNKNDETNQNTKGASAFSRENDNTIFSDVENHHSNNGNDDTVHSDDGKHHTKNGNDELNQNTEGAGDFSQENHSTVLSDDKNHHSTNEMNGNNEVFDFGKENDVLANDENDFTNNLRTIISENIDRKDNSESIHNSTNNISSEYHDNESKDSDVTTDDNLDQPLLKRQDKKRGRKTHKKLYNEGKAKKMEFKTFQCYVCFKLYETKEDLMSHCQEHFDICHSVTLSKCPICGHVSHKGIAQHLKQKHDICLKIPIHKLKRTDGSFPYSCDANGTKVELIPSVRILNKVASDTIDKKKREMNNQTIAKPKLVKIKNEWIVARETVPIEFDEIPEISDRDMHKLNICDNDVDRLGQISRLARMKALKMMYPCFKCDKICQTFSALKLHKRRHEDNPTPFKPKVKKCNRKIEKKVVKLNTANRTAFPKAILNKHKCDSKLKDFYESNIRGGDIEFWQFLKIYNRMNREKVEDFKDLENRSDFGNHFDYYKDVAGSADEM